MFPRKHGSGTSKECIFHEFMRCTILACLLALPAIAAMLPRTSPVVVVALENESYSDVVGASMPYNNSLIPTYALTGNFYADVHGSFPDGDFPIKASYIACQTFFWVFRFTGTTDHGRRADTSARDSFDHRS